MEDWITYAKIAATGAGGFLFKWIWDRQWKKVDVDDSRLKAIELKQTENDTREAERQKMMGRMEGEIQRLDGKVGGLQAFWSTKFERMEEKLEARLEAFRKELRDDQKAHEERMSGTLDAHQKRVHDRLNEAYAAQAAMINELMDKLVDRATGDVQIERG